MPSDREQTSPPLDELLLCQRIGRNLTHRACLRRQVDHQELLVQVGRKIQGREAKTEAAIGPPNAPFCNSGRCDLGNRIREMHPGAARSCERCGGAIVGEAACPRCAARAAEKTTPRVLPTKVAPSSRIWDASHVEPDFVPPAGAAPAPKRIQPKQQPTTASGEGEGKATGRAGNADPSPPPRPQPKEETMPKGVRSEPCPTCKSMATCCACKRSGAAKKAEPRKAPAKASRASPARAAARVVRGPRSDDDAFDAATATVEQLLDMVAACQEELRNRKAEVAEQLQAIEKAIGSAAA